MKLSIVTGFTLALLTLTGCSIEQLPKPSAETWTNGPCSVATPGVSLSIDYQGNVETHCALSFTGDGWSLFQAAGFEVKGTDKYPTAFACQINNQPAEAKCSDTATNGAYWGYYVANKGVWNYATAGAADRVSACGSHEGWVYMETDKTKSHLPAPTEFTCD